MTFIPSRIELHGAEVSLVPLDPGHASELATVAAESRDAYCYIRVPQGLDETRAYVEHALTQVDSGDRYPFAVRWRGKWVGTTSY